MEPTRIRDRSWFAPIVAVMVVIFIGLVSLTFLGSQVSGVLSTVGASVGGPGTVWGGGDDSSGSDDGDSGDDGIDDDGGDTGGSDGEPGSDSGGIVTAIARDDLLIIKTGSLTLRVGAIDAAVADATARMAALGGYVAGSDRSGTGREAVATVTFRVPAAEWDGAMTAMRALGSEVLLEHSTTQDVTGQVVDLGARIRNLQVTEQALQAIMDRATVIKDVLTVQAELTTVRGRIEQLASEKAHLEEQAAYSTLAVTFALEPAPVLVEQQAGYDPAAEVDEASASLVGILQRLATAGIWFGIVWLPVLAALAIVGGITFLVVRRLRRAVEGVPVA
jgi:hypothetical protein